FSVQHGGSHEVMPGQRCPVVGTRRIGVFVEKAVVAGGEGVVHVDLDASLREAAELVEIAEAVEKGGGPGIASTGCFAGFGDPEWLAGRELVAQLAVEVEDCVGACEPFLGESCLFAAMRRGHTCRGAALRDA